MFLETGGVATQILIQIGMMVTMGVGAWCSNRICYEMAVENGRVEIEEDYKMAQNRIRNETGWDKRTLPLHRIDTSVLPETVRTALSVLHAAN